MYVYWHVQGLGSGSLKRAASLARSLPLLFPSKERDLYG